MGLDPRIMQDWEIAEAAEERVKPIQQLAAELGLRGDELIPYGNKLAKVDYQKVLARLPKAPTGKYIDVTAITPTPLGEGKTTTTIGLIEGLGKLGKRVCGAIRQPSSGPTFNIKGSAAGGGLAQCIPADAHFHPSDRRHRLCHQRAQPGHGGVDGAAPARAQLRRRPAGEEQSETPGHRPEPGADWLGHRLLRPIAAEDPHRPRRQDGWLRDGLGLPDDRRQRSDGDPRRRAGPEGPAGADRPDGRRLQP